MARRNQTYSEKTTSNENWSCYVRARDSGHTEYLRDAERYNEFYAGDQWDDQDVQKLENEGRPHLTINQILPTINTVLGEQAANRVVLKMKPMRNASYEDARMLEKISLHVLEQNDYGWKEGEVFADGLIQDRGYFDLRMDFSNNLQGEISISVEDPNDIVLDPDAKEYDPDTWKEVIKTRWLSMVDIEDEYGREAAKKVTGHIRSHEDFDPDSFEFAKHFGDSTSVGRFRYDGDKERDLRSVRVIERQHKKYYNKCRFFISETGDLSPVPDFMDEETADYYAVQHGYQIMTRPGFKIRWTVSAGEDVLLYDEWSPYPWFTIIPFFPYFRRGRPFGMVKNLMSPQEQLNKLSSQELHIINTTANSGWIIEEGSLGDGLTLSDVEAKGAKTGFVISYKNGRQAPQKIQANQIPTGVDRMSMKAQVFIRDISGVSAGMQGNASPYTSGRALQDQIQRSQVQIQKPMDNLARTRRMLGDKLLYLIQTYYTEERVFHVGTDLEPGVTDEEITINQQTAEGIANDVTLGKYKVTVSQQPVVDNYQDAQLSNLIELRSAGVMIPDHLIIKYTDLHDKDELSELLKRAAGMHEPTPEEQELAQFQQQAMIQSIQLDLAQKQAKVEELMAKVDMTKAQTASEVDPDAIKNVLEIMRLQADIQKNIDNLNARLRMSEMSQRATLQKTGAQQLVQMRGQDMQQESTAMQTAAQLQAARENAQNSSNGDS